ncbi:hypothetical protein Leryth_006178 [Lithospermum erythrorhizon]|nr:hypothetical protein Leryth_006178 [Lithospermum erythrorhizon]
MFNGMSEMALTIFKLPVFFKQRNLLFYPSWAYALPTWILKIPISLVEAVVWIVLTYYEIGLDPNIIRYTIKILLEFSLTMLILVALSGIILSRTLMGVSGAGKTTLMDVLAGRKTGGYTEGDIKISGYPKKQETFARISGYYEQNDIHSPHVTVYESLVYSAWLQLPSEVDYATSMIFMIVEFVFGKFLNRSFSSNVRFYVCQLFVDEVMELTPLRGALVGLPGVNGLSTKQCKPLS